jgi:hypothetical protein
MFCEWFRDFTSYFEVVSDVLVISYIDYSSHDVFMCPMC